MIWLILTGLLWGVSNYLMEIHFFDYSEVDHSQGLVFRIRTFIESNWKSVLIYLLGQIGSVLFYYSLGSESSLSSVVVTANGLSILTGIILETLHKRKSHEELSKILVASVLVLSGISLILNHEAEA